MRVTNVSFEKSSAGKVDDMKNELNKGATYIDYQALFWLSITIIFIYPLLSLYLESSYISQAGCDERTLHKKQEQKC